MAKNNHGKTIILPLAKMHCWANHGKSSAEIAELIGITPDEMFDRLSSLSQKKPQVSKVYSLQIRKKRLHTQHCNPEANLAGRTRTRQHRSGRDRLSGK